VKGEHAMIRSRRWGCSHCWLKKTAKRYGEKTRGEIIILEEKAGYRLLESLLAGAAVNEVRHGIHKSERSDDIS